jgi:hypothetical protein
MIRRDRRMEAQITGEAWPIEFPPQNIEDVAVELVVSQVRREHVGDSAENASSGDGVWVAQTSSFSAMPT